MMFVEKADNLYEAINEDEAEPSHNQSEIEDLVKKNWAGKGRTGKHQNGREAPYTQGISEQKSWAVDQTSKPSNSAGNSRNNQNGRQD